MELWIAFSLFIFLLCLSASELWCLLCSLFQENRIFLALHIFREIFSIFCFHLFRREWDPTWRIFGRKFYHSVVHDASRFYRFFMRSTTFLWQFQARHACKKDVPLKRFSSCFRTNFNRSFLVETWGWKVLLLNIHNVVVSHSTPPTLSPTKSLCILKTILFVYLRLVFIQTTRKISPHIGMTRWENVLNSFGKLDKFVSSSLAVFLFLLNKFSLL